MSRHSHGLARPGTCSRGSGASTPAGACPAGGWTLTPTTVALPLNVQGFLKDVYFPKHGRPPRVFVVTELQKQLDLFLSPPPATPGKLCDVGGSWKLF